MPTGLATWSNSAASNASADSAVNWAEGQAPSTINDSARAMMASAAKWRDDISGLIVSGGTSTAYTMTSRQGFATLPAMDGLEFAFTPHVTCGDNPSLSIDGLSGQPIMAATGVSIPGGTLLAGTPYKLLYHNATNTFFLQNFFGNPYNVPIGASMDYWSLVAPNSSFAFVNGQAISRTTYSALFYLIGTLYGTGNGTTTFNLPNKTGRTSVMRDPSGTLITGAVFNSVDLGGIGGSQMQSLNVNNIPPYTPAGGVNSPVSFTVNRTGIGYTPGSTQAWMVVPDGFSSNLGPASQSGISVASTFTGTAQGGSSQPFPITQPSIVCNHIMRII